jgi:hypothetical protein
MAGLSDELKEEIIRVAGTRQLIPGILTYDVRTGKWFMPKSGAERPKRAQAKRKRKGRMSKASRRKNRRK